MSDALKQFGNWASKYLSKKPKMRALADDETGEIYSSLDELGREVLDDTPMAPPVGFNPQPSLAETIRAMVRSERLAQELQGTDMETFEESEDFDVGEDYDPSTPYENDFDPDIAELREAVSQEQSKADQDADSVPAKKKSSASPTPVSEPLSGSDPEPLKKG